MEYFFPVLLAVLLILFLVTNFDLVSTVVGYLLMVGMITAVVGAIAYGLYEALGSRSAIFLVLVALGIWAVTRARDSVNGFIKGFATGYRAGPGEKA
ncbi:MAG: hypothetical protein IPM20_05025 [Gammaproteobacteria bacterium]|nr:hypothetical protein [Gammaproteobacteria bacterium]